MAERRISTHLARAVEARLRELKMSPTEFEEATGLTGTGLLNLRNGLVRKYQVRLTRPVCEVLGWTPDSIERLLAGQPAQLIEPGTAGTAGARESPSEIDDLRRSIARNRAELEAFEARLDALEHRGGAGRAATKKKASRPRG